jgi:hypothetical protein
VRGVGAGPLRPGSERDTITDVQGRFDLGVVPSAWDANSPTRLLIAKQDQRNLVAALPVDQKTRRLDIKLQPGIVLSGKVVGPENKPLARASVDVMLDDQEWSEGIGLAWRAVTAADGSFAVPALPAGQRYKIAIVAPGCGLREVPARSDDAKDNRLDIGVVRPLPANLSVSGRVVDREGKPIAGARLLFFGDGQPVDINFRRPILTDPQGKFTIEGVCEGKLQIMVSTTVPTRRFGTVETQGGMTDLKIVISEAGEDGGYVPRKPPSLVGKPLPELKPVGVELPAEAKDRMLLVCLCDVDQRPSRRCVTQLAGQAGRLGEKGVTVVVVQAALADEWARKKWMQENKIPFPVGAFPADVDKMRFAWGVTSLPHLVLTDKKRTVVAEGFELSDLDQEIESAAGR